MSKIRLGKLLLVSYGLAMSLVLNVNAANLVQAIRQEPLHTTKTFKRHQVKLPAIQVSKTPSNYVDNGKRAVHVTLADAIGIALRKNPTIEKAYLQRINDKFTFKIAKQQFEIQPTLGASSIYSTPLRKPFNQNQTMALTPGAKLDTPFGTSIAFTWANNYSDHFESSEKTLTISQHLLQGLGADVNEITLKNAYDSAYLAKLTLKQSIISTVTQVITDYRALQSAEMTSANDSTSLKLAKKTLSDYRKRLALGLVASADIYQYLSQVSETKVDIQTDLNSLQQAKITLSNDLGIDPDTDLVVPTKVYVPHVVPNLKVSDTLALANDQTYLTDIVNIRKDKRGLLSARDKARWTLDLNATVQRTSYGKHGVSLGTTTIANAGDEAGLSLTVPLGTQRLQNKANIVSAKISYQNDMINLRNDKRKLLNSVRQSIETINIDLKRLHLAQQDVTYKQRALETLLKKSNIGMASASDVSTGQTNLRTAQQTLITDETSYLSDLSNFDQTVGTTLNTWKIKVHY